MQPFDIEQPQKHPPDDGHATSEYHEYRYRWVIVALFGLCTMSNAIASNACFPIATKLATTYGVSNAAVNSVAMIFLLVYTIMNFPANYIVDSRGLRIGVPSINNLSLSSEAPLSASGWGWFSSSMVLSGGSSWEPL